MKRKFHHKLYSPARGTFLPFVLLLAALFLAPSAPANDFTDYSDYGTPTDQLFVVMPEITAGWFAATDYFPDNGENDKIGIYETRGRALVANDTYIYLQKNYGAGAGKGTWAPGDDYGFPVSVTSPPAGAGTANMPGGSDNWIVVARVNPGTGEFTGGECMDPSFLHISPDGNKVALGMGYNQPLIIFPIDVLDPVNPPFLNDVTDAEEPNPSLNGVVVFPWGSTPTAGVHYYDAEWAPDPWDDLSTLEDEVTLDPSASSNNTFLLMNNDRGWSSGTLTGDGSQIEILDTSDDSNRPVVIIQNIGDAPYFSASADVTIDNFGNLITGQGYDYNNPTGANSRTGQIMIYSFSEWSDGYNGSWSSPDPIDYYLERDPSDPTDSEGHIVADKVLSVAALGVDKDNNLHVGGGDVVGGVLADEAGYMALINAGVLEDALDDESNVGVIAGDPSVDLSSEYKEIQPDEVADDSATFGVYNPWAESIVVIWNPRNFSTPGGLMGTGPYDGWYPKVVPIATSYYTSTAPNFDADSIPNGSDNAYYAPNQSQTDTDGDGWANIADADFDNDDQVTQADYNAIQAIIDVSGYDAEMDLDFDLDVDLTDRNNVQYHQVNFPNAPWYF